MGRDESLQVRLSPTAGIAMEICWLRSAGDRSLRSPISILRNNRSKAMMLGDVYTPRWRPAALFPHLFVGFSNGCRFGRFGLFSGFAGGIVIPNSVSPMGHLTEVAKLISSSGTIRLVYLIVCFRYGSRLVESKLASTMTMEDQEVYEDGFSV
jgi:hypothetical protein